MHLSEHLFTNVCIDVESFEVMIPPQNDKPGLKKGFPWKEHENSTFAWVPYFPFFHFLTKKFTFYPEPRLIVQESLYAKKYGKEHKVPEEI